MIILIAVIAYNELYLKKQLDKADESYNLSIAELELNYLKKNFALNFSKGEFDFPVSDENKILVYIPKTVCVSCVDKLLHILKGYEIDSNVLIFVDSEEHAGYIAGFNDRFLNSFKIEVSKNLVRSFQNNLIIYSTIDNKIDMLLAFNSGDESYFKKYFERYML